MRTTLDLDPSVMQQLKVLKKREKKTIGHLANSLLAEALARRTEESKPGTHHKIFPHTRKMNAKVDLADKEALWKMLDER